MDQLQKKQKTKYSSNYDYLRSREEKIEKRRKLFLCTLLRKFIKVFNRICTSNLQWYRVPEPNNFNIKGSKRKEMITGWNFWVRFLSERRERQ
ncbi:unnamed protein product [Parnassius apollo]|uniref:(apollo) hypothetical protein n=1 Tax=Parnassius apollo TaxID=110799 RepID=A0A8S3XSE7_PARAO|nr:unnamed protein product [Parnassius apollo]